MLQVHQVSAFTWNGQGGNPAGVALCESFPKDHIMKKIAKEVGYSETSFLHPFKDGWRIRYFAPEIEVPFCGHATIATGAILGKLYGEGTYNLYLNNGEIQVRVNEVQGSFTVSLTSPKTWSKEASVELIEQARHLFGLSKDDLNPNMPIRLAHAGATHLILFLNSRDTLRKMDYPFEDGKDYMIQYGLTTISLLWLENEKTIHARNAFAVGGVVEDPATGAAAAALAGYFRDISFPNGGSFRIIQGEDMNNPSELLVTYTNKIGEGVEVSGRTRKLGALNL